MVPGPGTAASCYLLLQWNDSDHGARTRHGSFMLPPSYSGTTVTMVPGPGTAASCYLPPTVERLWPWCQDQARQLHVTSLLQWNDCDHGARTRHGSFMLPPSYSGTTVTMVPGPGTAASCYLPPTVERQWPWCPDQARQLHVTSLLQWNDSDHGARTRHGSFMLPHSYSGTTVTMVPGPGTAASCYLPPAVERLWPWCQDQARQIHVTSLLQWNDCDHGARTRHGSFMLPPSYSGTTVTMVPGPGTADSCYLPPAVERLWPWCQDQARQLHVTSLLQWNDCDHGARTRHGSFMLPPSYSGTTVTMVPGPGTAASCYLPPTVERQWPWCQDQARQLHVTSLLQWNDCDHGARTRHGSFMLPPSCSGTTVNIESVRYAAGCLWSGSIRLIIDGVCKIEEILSGLVLIL